MTRITETIDGYPRIGVEIGRGLWEMEVSVPIKSCSRKSKKLYVKLSMVGDEGTIYTYPRRSARIFLGDDPSLVTAENNANDVFILLLNRSSPKTTKLFLQSVNTHSPSGIEPADAVTGAGGFIRITQRMPEPRSRPRPGRSIALSPEKHRERVCERQRMTPKELREASTRAEDRARAASWEATLHSFLPPHDDTAIKLACAARAMLERCEQVRDRQFDNPTQDSVGEVERLARWAQEFADDARKRREYLGL